MNNNKINCGIEAVEKITLNPDEDYSSFDPILEPAINYIMK